MSEVLDIPVSDIHVGDRLSMPTDKDVEDVAGSMALEGLLQPIGVNRIRKKFHLVFGLTRLLAARKLGWDTIQAKVWEAEDTDTVTAMEIAENIKRRKLTKLQELDQLQRYDSIYGRKQIKKRVGRPKKGDNANATMSQADMAESMGKSISTYKKDMAAARNLRKGTRDVLKGSAYEDATSVLLAIARIDNPKQQQQIAATLTSQEEMPVMDAMRFVEDQREVITLLDELEPEVSHHAQSAAPVKLLTEPILRELGRIKDVAAQMEALELLAVPGHILSEEEAVEILWAARKEWESMKGIRQCEIINTTLVDWMNDDMQPGSVDIIMTSATREDDMRVFRDIATLATKGLSDRGLLYCFMEIDHFSDAFKVLSRSLTLVSMSAVSWTEPNGTAWTPVGIWAKSDAVDGPEGMVLVEKNRAYDAMLRVASDLLRPILESGMVVVDPMCRRGAIPIAAWSLGAHAIGLESDEGDAAYAQRNVDNHSGT